MKKFNQFLITNLFKLIIVAIAAFIGFVIADNSNVYAAQATVDNNGIDVIWQYDVNSDNTATLVKIVKWNGKNLTDSTVKNSAHDVIIPGIIDGHTVTVVGTGSKIASTTSGDDTFFYSVVIPSTVKSIGAHAFENAVSMKYVTFESDTELESIGECAFKNNERLTKMTSGSRSENGCLTLPSSLKTIGAYAFEMNPNSQHYSISSKYDEVIPHKKNVLGWQYFTTAVPLFSKVVLGENITDIGDFAFAGCDRLDTLTIPNTTSNARIGKGTFAYCALRNLTFAERTTRLTLDDFAFSYQKSINTSLTLTSNISLGKCVFKHNNKLKNVTIECTELGENIFEENTALETVVFDNAIKVIPGGYFIGCENLQSITAPGVTVIESGALSGTNGLTTLNVGTLKYIGDYAFANNTGLTTEKYNQLVPSTNKIALGRNVFNGCTNLTGTVNLNLSMNTVTENGKEYVPSAEYTFQGTNIKKAIITSDENITKLPNGMFSGCNLLEDVDLPNTINNIGNSAFSGCSRITLNVLQNKIINNAVTIGSAAFYGNTGITGTLTLPETVQQVKSSAFENCIGITGELTLPEALKEIDDRAFYNTGITKVNYNTTLEKLGTLALPNENEIIRIPSTRLNYVAKNAFINVREAFFNVESIAQLLPNWNGPEDVIIHYKNHKHTVNLYSTLPGVKLLNADTNEEITSAEFTCETDVNLKVQIESGYSYPDLAVKVISGGQYLSSALTREFAELNENNEFTFESITRDKTIIIQKNRNQTDLELRQYITTINGEKVDTSRAPVINTTRKVYNLDEIKYQHIKYPITVKQGDNITYKIVVYNEGDTVGKVNELRAYLPDGLELASNSEGNWEVVSTTDEGTIIKTKYLQSKDITAYRGEGRPEYEEVELTCTLTKEEKPYLAVITELSESNDVDSIAKNITVNMLEDYKKDESYTSYESSYIKSAEDDTDYECIAIKNVLRVGYRIALEKIDSTNLELLNGAKFNLYNENQELIESQRTVEDGKLVFNEQISFGEGTDTYYIEEVETPAGYKKTIDGLLELKVRKYISTEGEVSLEIMCDVDERYDFAEEHVYIPISSVEDLRKIGTSTVVEINGESHMCTSDAWYELKNDIDLDGVEWTPISEFSGVLEGNGHKIKNLTMPAGTTSEKFGLFADASGYIKNLTLENVNISSSNANPLYIGAFAGYAGNSSVTVFENCTVTGTINASNAANVGGFVGEAKEERDIKFKNCINNANVTGLKNVGGLVGCSKGDTDLVNCVNNGTIEAAQFNAGGFIGAGMPTGNTPENIVVGYNEATATITIAIKNKKTVTGSYNLVLEKIEKSEGTTSGTYINGALFNIYNENMELIQENLEVTEGKLKIADIVVNSLKSDVFYIKEVKAPEGYDILVKDYVKVIVTKKWNSEEEKYEIDITPEVVEGQTETEDNSINTNTGATSDFAGSTYVRYGASRVKASESINNGKVVANGTGIDVSGSAGGIVGTHRGTANINNCKNLGTIQATTNAGGLLGQLYDAPNIESRIRNSSNGDKDDTENVYGTVELLGDGSSTHNLGGIVGFSKAELLITDCYNYSNFAGKGQTGGIIGLSRGKSLTIDHCYNYADIENSTYDATTGGIIGSFRGNTNFGSASNTLGITDVEGDNANCIIRYCEFKGNINNVSGSRENHVGGIAGLVASFRDTDTATISYCIVGDENSTTNITTADEGMVGGILGRANIGNIVVTDNEVENVEIQSEKDSCGGLIGTIGNNYDTKSIIVANNIVSNAEISAQNHASGLIAMIQQNGGFYGETANTGNALIDNNIVKNSLIKDSTSPNDNGKSRAGLIGFMSIKLAINIKGCKVINTDIELNDTRGANVQASGLVGMANVYSLRLENCEVKSTENEKHSIKLSYSATYNTNSLGGLVAYNWCNPDSITQITGCKVSNMIFEKSFTGTESGYGDVGGIIGHSYNSVDMLGVEVDNIDIVVKEVENITNRRLYNGIGGFIGGEHISSQDRHTITIRGCKFTNSTINVDGEGVIGGIIGSSMYANNTINGPTISNVKIKTNIKEYTGSNSNNPAIGGVIGYTSTNFAITGGTVEEVEIKNQNSSNTRLVGGLVGEGNGSFTGVNVKNIKLDCNFKVDSNPQEVGGLIAYANGPITISNVNAEGVDIKSNHANVGGFIGFASKDTTINNDSSIKNVKLELTEAPNSGINYPGCFGGLVGNTDRRTNNNGNVSITPIVDNVEIKIPFIREGRVQMSLTYGNDVHAGGVIGFGEGIKILGGTVNDVKITNDSLGGTVGGIAGTLNDSNTNITGTKVSNFIGNGNHRIGGIAGYIYGTITGVTVENMDTLVSPFVPKEYGDFASTYPIDMKVGGIAGAAFANITSAKVTTTDDKTHELKSKDVAGGIAAFNYNLVKDSTVENITISSDRNIVTTTKEIPDKEPENGPSSEPEADIETESLTASVSPLVTFFGQEPTNCTIHNIILKHIVDGENLVETIE